MRGRIKIALSQGLEFFFSRKQKYIYLSTALRFSPLLRNLLSPAVEASARLRAPAPPPAPVLSSGSMIRRALLRYVQEGPLPERYSKNLG
jgi:hypothetical protein